MAQIDTEAVEMSRKTTATQKSTNISDGEETSLLTFQPMFNFHRFVQEHMMTHNSQVDKLVSQSARIIGQEGDGSMLIVWDAPISTSSEKIVTHIGIYHPSSPSYRTLFIHEHRVEISGASVDSFKSLLAFTVCEKLTVGVNYDTFVAEINPCNRVFSLNLCSTDFRKLQFVQAAQSSHRRHAKQPQKSSLLIIIPDNWICLYSFQLEPIDKGYTVISQPSQDIVVEECPWYQWDPELQWLCYARFGSTPTQTKRPGKGNAADSSVILHVVSFNGGEQKVILTVALPIPFHHNHYTESANYYMSPLAFSLPVHELNMKVLHNKEGIWCVCLQHKNGSPTPTSQHHHSQSSHRIEPKLEYSVYLLHNGHVIDGEVPLKEAKEGGHHIQFMLLGNFILAYVPGVMFHLLNISIHTDPCHHLILKGNHAPMLPEISDTNSQHGRRVLTTAVSLGIKSDVSSPVFDSYSSCFYSCRLEPLAILSLFATTSDPELHLTLLHITIIGIRQYSVALQMIERICQTPFSLADSRIFQEFILALSYANVHPESPALLARHLPFTNSLTYRGGIYKDPDGTKYTILRCTEMSNFVKQLLVQSDQKLVSATSDQLFTYVSNPVESFDHLCFNAVLNQPSIYRRMNLEDLAMQVRALALSTPALPANVKKRISIKDKLASHEASPTLTKSGIFVNKLKDLIHSPRSGRHGQSTGHIGALSFLLPDEDLDNTIALHSNLLHDRLVQVMSSKLVLHVKNSITRMCKNCEDYWSELQRVSRILLHIIWQSMKFTNETHPLQMSIHRQASMEEHILFELLESYYMAHMELGIPAPSGFATLFVCMGYICLEPSVFVQYLSNGVFIPTRRFLQLLLTNCDEVDEQFLYEIVSNLGPESQQIAFELWKHPVLVQLLSRDSSTGSSGSQR